MNGSPILLGGAPLTIADIVRVAREHVSLALTDRAVGAIQDSCATLQRALGGPGMVYGATTGVGALDGIAIDANEGANFARQLIRSHAAGVGPKMPEDAVRAMIAVRAANLAQGARGVTLATVCALLSLLEHRII